MKKNTKIKLAGVLLGAALSSTGAYAGNGSCGAGKCGGDTKKKANKGEMSGNAGKKSVASCGAGKCGANDKAKKKVEGSCGAGKCG